LLICRQLILAAEVHIGFITDWQPEGVVDREVDEYKQQRKVTSPGVIDFLHRHRKGHVLGADVPLAIGRQVGKAIRDREACRHALRLLHRRKLPSPSNCFAARHQGRTIKREFQRRRRIGKSVKPIRQRSLVLSGCPSGGTEGRRQAAARYPTYLVTADSQREIFQENLPRPLVENKVVHADEENSVGLSLTKGETHGWLCSQVERELRPLHDCFDYCRIGSRR
jgi:hypothetical protein